MHRSDRLILTLAAIGGAALVIIGARFFFWPDLAARFFGIAPRPQGTELHTAVALRDIWLGLLALAFAYLRDWRALALWFGCGTLVCFGDAALVANATGKPQAIVFHTLAGLACAALAAACWSRRNR